MIQVIKEYYNDTYKKEISAKIVDIVDNKVYLDKTIFYPEGGGQPGDKGYINDIEVFDTQKDGDQISHYVKDSSSLSIGMDIILKLDWEYRYNYMKMHSAQHLLSGLLYSVFNVGTVSVHQGVENLTIEIDKADFSIENCYELEDIANKKILEVHEISYLEMDKTAAENLNMRRSIKVDSDVRIVKIEDIDLIACGGLHVKNTKEIEKIMYIGFEKIRKHYRLLFRVSNEVTKICREYDNVIKTLCTLHSATLDTLVECDKSLLNKKLELEKEVRLLKKENTDLIISNLLNTDENIITKNISEYNIDFKDIDVTFDKALFFYKIDSSLLRWFIYLGPSYEKYNINDIRKNVLCYINGKGGGKAPYFQGKGELNNIDKCEKAFLGYFNGK